MEINVNDVAASFQQAVIDVLSDHLIDAAVRYGAGQVALREALPPTCLCVSWSKEKAEEKGFRFAYPKPVLCTDNAAMIGCAAYYEYQKGVVADMSLNAYANLEL